VFASSGESVEGFLRERHAEAAREDDQPYWFWTPPRFWPCCLGIGSAWPWHSAASAPR
jgi:hypothetical protein